MNRTLPSLKRRRGVDSVGEMMGKRQPKCQDVQNGSHRFIHPDDVPGDAEKRAFP